MYVCHIYSIVVCLAVYMEQGGVLAEAGGWYFFTRVFRILFPGGGLLGWEESNW